MMPSNELRDLTKQIYKEYCDIFKSEIFGNESSHALFHFEFDLSILINNYAHKYHHSLNEFKKHLDEILIGIRILLDEETEIQYHNHIKRIRKRINNSPVVKSLLNKEKDFNGIRVNINDTFEMVL